MTKSISHEATEWFCDNCSKSAIVIRKNYWDPKLPEGWTARKVKDKWYQLFNKWRLFCPSCSKAIDGIRN